MVRFCQLLTFHLYFQLRLLVKVPRMGILGNKCKALSSKELSNGIVILIKVRQHLSVSVCALGLTLVAVVVVGIWDEISPLRGIWWRSQWGEWYGVPRSDGMVL